VAAKLFKPALLALALGTAALVPAAAAQAQAQPQMSATSVEIPLNKSQVVSADRPIAKALVGNSEIADVVPLTDRSIYVLGKKMGTTSLTLYDSGGRVLSILDISVGPDVIALEEQLRQVVPNETINARISNRSIVLTGLVNSAGAADRANQLAKAYIDEKEGGSVINLIAMGSSQQVMVEVRFAEVRRFVGKEVGVKLSGQSRNGSFNGITGTGSGYFPGLPGVTEQTFDGAGNLISTTTKGAILPYLSSIPITESFGVFRQQIGLGSLSINAMLNALESRDLAKTLAQPTLIALSGEKASFLAGGEFPVPVKQDANGAITVEFKPFGISLAFTPTVLGDKTISLVVEPEVSAIDPQASLKIDELVIPGLRTRRANTTLELRDGESFAIAGLLSKDFETTVEQVPLLGSIPILGALFRSSSFRKGETELLIVVTPRLVQPIKPEQVRLPTDRVLDPRETDTILLGQPYRPAPVEPAAPSENAAKSNAKKKEDGLAY
jgi:pilus assembly protein CpaC